MLHTQAYTRWFTVWQSSDRRKLLQKRSSKSVTRIPEGNRLKPVMVVQTHSSDMSSLIPGGRRDPTSALHQRIGEIGSKTSYKKGATLFAQGENPRGIFLITEGAAKLSTASADGRSLILGFLGPGKILGLAAAILGRSFETTAETSEPTTAIFLPRDVFLRLTQESTRMAFDVAQQLSERRFKLLDELRIIGLSESAQQKLGVFLLGLCPDRGRRGSGTRIHLPGAKQDDLAQMLGVSRETTNRLLSFLGKSNILAWKRGTLVIRNWSALKKLAGFREVGAK